jgi:hypothetical protein
MDLDFLETILPKTPTHWSQEETARWLEHIGLAQLAPTFQSNCIDGSILLRLEQDDLEKELNITSAIMRKKLLACPLLTRDRRTQTLRAQESQKGDHQFRVP